MRKYTKPRIEQVVSLDDLLKKLQKGDPELTKEGLLGILQETQMSHPQEEEAAAHQE